MTQTLHRWARKATTGLQLVRRGPLKCRSLAFSLLSGRRALEIGGPSAVFRHSWYLPVYDKLQSVDNCDYQKENAWATHGETFDFHRAKPRGKTYICEATELGDIPGRTYDVILSSHCLEHIANPIRALHEWQRVLKPRGSLVIVLPNYSRTFDRNRTATPISHMIVDYEQNTKEDDLTHLEEAYNNKLDYSIDPDEVRTLLTNNYRTRMIHHHTFDEVNSRQLLEAAGINVLAVECHPPCHIFLIAQRS